MKRAILAGSAIALLVSGCGQDPKGTAITPSLLEDQGRIQSISNRLEPADREKFGRYVLNRTMTHSGLAKPLVNDSGQDPKTVGEAISLVDAWGANRAKAEELRAERDARIAELDAKRDRLNEIAEASRWAPGPTEAANAVIKEIEAVHAEYEPRLAALQ